MRFSRPSISSGGVRLIGVTVSSLEAGGPAGGEAAPAPVQQLELIPHEADEPEMARNRAMAEVDAAVDAIRRRYGAAAVGPAAVTSSGGLRVKSTGDTAWGPAADETPAGPP